MATKSTTKAESVEKIYEPTEEIIQQDSYIRVMSLIPFPLNLSTKEGGQGTVKRFTRFGEIKNILLRDLMDIIDNHQNFLENGYFYILSKTFIRQNGLDEIYSKILTKDKIEQILAMNSDEAVEIFQAASKGQQDMIIQMLIIKLRDNPESVNLNVIDKISRLSKVNIVEIVEDAKAQIPASEEK